MGSHIQMLNLLLVCLFYYFTIGQISTVETAVNSSYNSSHDFRLVNNDIEQHAKANMSKADKEHEGFGLFFKSNKNEMINFPITFKPPLPAWLNGTLVRNGPGMFENGPRSFLHLFDGFAKLVSWRFLGNKTALFSTRFIQSMFYKSSIKAKTITPYLLFQSVEPPFGYIEKLQCLKNGMDNMNVNIYAFQNPKNKMLEYAAISDFWIVYKVAIAKLSTKHRVISRIKKKQSAVSDLDGLGFLNLLSSAHPLPEPGTNNYLNFLLSVSAYPWRSHVMSIVRIKSLKRRTILAQSPVDRVPYMHSFSVSATRIILLASPFYVNVLCMALRAEPFSCLDWYPKEPATLYIVNLRSGNVTTISIKNIFTMHHVNAYDVGEKNIIMDVSSYPSPDLVSHLQLHVLRDPVKRNSFDAHAQLKRIFIDLTKLEAYEIPLDLGPTPSLASLLDMPVINEAYRSRHYCFVYGLVLKSDNRIFSTFAIAKKDVCQRGGRDRIWQIEGHYPLEPWFVAHPEGVDEDDGLLLIPVLQGERQVTYLAVLDARTLTLVTKADLPINLPYSFHGTFFPGV